MKLTKSRLNKIMNCKVQTRKKKSLIKNDTTNTNTNTNTKRRHNRYFNLRNNTLKNWSVK